MEVFGEFLIILMRLFVAAILVPVFVGLLVLLTVGSGIAWALTGLPLNVHATYPDWS